MLTKVHNFPSTQMLSTSQDVFEVGIFSAVLELQGQSCSHVVSINVEFINSVQNQV